MARSSKPTLIYITYETAVPTSQKTQSVSITNAVQRNTLSCVSKCGVFRYHSTWYKQLPLDFLQSHWPVAFCHSLAAYLAQSTRHIVARRTIDNHCNRFIIFIDYSKKQSKRPMHRGYWGPANWPARQQTSKNQPSEVPLQSPVLFLLATTSRTTQSRNIQLHPQGTQFESPKHYCHPDYAFLQCLQVHVGTVPWQPSQVTRFGHVNVCT